MHPVELERVAAQRIQRARDELLGVASPGLWAVLNDAAVAHQILTIIVDRSDACSECDGDGTVGTYPRPCEACNGTGEISIVSDALADIRAYLRGETDPEVQASSDTYVRGVANA
jgi:hypothetical protein